MLRGLEQEHTRLETGSEVQWYGVGGATNASGMSGTGVGSSEASGALVVISGVFFSPIYRRSVFI